MDNSKNSINSTQPKVFEIEDVYLYNMHHPDMLKVNKLFRAEYWPLHTQILPMDQLRLRGTIALGR
jgi:hypothetical protein